MHLPRRLKFPRLFHAENPTTGEQARAASNACARCTVAALAAACLLTGSACRTGPTDTSDKADEPPQQSAREEASPPVDVAGHLTIAAQTDLQAVQGRWEWGAVPVGIAVGADGAVYWTQYRTNTIERVGGDGNHRRTLATVNGPLGLAYDRTSNRVFYTSDRNYPRSISTLDANDMPETLVYGDRVNRPFAIAVAEKSGRLYWTESVNGRIRSADTDGGDLATFFDDGIANEDEKTGAIPLSSAGLAVDETRGLLFWSDTLTATIVRARLDGSERNIILSRDQGLDNPTALALDPLAGKLYWADPGKESIGRSDLNGLNPEIIASDADGVLEPYGLAIDPERRLLYWTDVARNALYRTSLDHRRVERFFELDKPSIRMAEIDQLVSPCEAAAVRARQEFLRRWIKLVRTCVVGVSATNAVMRSPYELRLPALTCATQLHLAHDVSALRAALEPHCNDRQVNAAIDDTLELGAGIALADLPRAAVLLRKVRPFIAGEGTLGTASTEHALETLDDLARRLERLEQGPASAIAWTLPASGQKTVYAASTQLAGGVTAVPDDGTARAGAPLSYVDNGDGTITDSNTGLMWEKKCDDCDRLHSFKTRLRWRPGDVKLGVHEWLKAVNAEDGTGFAGYDDWRLPEVGELLNIVDYEQFNPAVSAAFDAAGCGLDCTSPRTPDCSCTNAGAYWTAAPSPGSEALIPVVAFHLGLVWARPAESDAFVRAVRLSSAVRGTGFVDNGDGTITDRRSRLMWEKKVLRAGDLHDVDRRLYWSFDGTQETIWDWVAAVNSKGGKGFAGYDDWRIPNVKELYTLFDPQHLDPSIDPVFGTGQCEEGDTAGCSLTADTPHWTSTTFADFPSLAVTVGFSTPGKLEREAPSWVIRVTGGVEPHEKTVHMAVRAVRGPVDAAAATAGEAGGSLPDATVSEPRSKEPDAVPQG